MSDLKAPSAFREFIGSNRAVVCGQAVNLWALFFLGRGQYVSELRPLEPFVSHDIDLLGDEETFAELKKFGKWTLAIPVKPKEGQRIDLVGILQAIQPDGSTILVEIRRHVRGLNDDDLTRLTAVNIGKDETFYLMEAPYVLKGKIANYCEIPQNTPGRERQDGRHIRIMIPCVHGYITNASEIYAFGDLSKDDFLRLLRDTKDILGSGDASKVAQALGLDFTAAIPDTIFNHEDDEIRAAVAGLRRPRAR
jgi:hypothetical protein